ncbi:Protein GLUTAMINE DUMPER 7 [Cardamine amara subsp. amara]|uniref:Protein GLUTAMINE DUMPER 7 n=1 Tax=Cardamine amara subsp. amara TaxID=228776 RepID=A0ABD1C0Q5_CARAN
MSMVSDSIVPVNHRLENLNSSVLSKICAWAIMLGLIAVSLIAIACACYNKKTTSNLFNEEQEKLGKKQVLKPLEMEPKIVVIMAGNENPTFFAKPTKINA